MLGKTSKINGNSTDTLTKYDIHSIMHYDGTLRGYFSNPVLTDKITGKGIPVNREMSPLDIQKLNKMYPCKPIGPACGKCIRTSCFTTPIFFSLDQASNQALKDEINRLNREVDNLHTESQTLNRSNDERGLQIQDLQNKLNFCETKDKTQANKRKF